MPELAEIKLTAEYINQSAKDLIFTEVIKNPAHKGAEIKIPFTKFQLHAESRGKEIVLYILEVGDIDHIPIRMSMGMSGHFKLTKTGAEPKHSHLQFKTINNHTLNFVDVRRFGKWKVGETWSENRGPCPVAEHDAFIGNILENLDRRIFDKPLMEIMMDQKYFNGIGNYLRAEILYRLPHVNPFQPARMALESEPEIFKLCREIPELAYVLGGGKLKSWENPLGEAVDLSKPKQQLFQCYGNSQMSKIKDKTGRTFWYDPKWDGIDLNTEWDYYSGLPNPKAYENINS